MRKMTVCKRKIRTAGGDKLTLIYSVTIERPNRKPEIPSYDTFIIATDDKSEAIRAMCEYVYEHTYPAQLGDKDAERGRLLKYCDDFLAGKQSAQNSKAQESPVAERKKTDRGDR